MPDKREVFSPYLLPEDDPSIGGLRRGRRPVIFDILAPDRTTSLLDAVEKGLRLVLHVNPTSMQFSYAKQTQRIQTRGGFVEFHWGDAAEEITFDGATGGFMRLYSGLSNITGSQGRRETIAYDKYLDLLALFHNNGAIFDMFGNIVIQGYIKMTFDGGIHTGWFDGQFTVTESAEQPYIFVLSTRFILDKEVMRQVRSTSVLNAAGGVTITPPVTTAGLTGAPPGEILQSVFEGPSLFISEPPEPPIGAPATSILEPSISVGNMERLPPEVQESEGIAGLVSLR